MSARMEFMDAADASDASEVPAAPRIYTTWFRCVRDGRDHAVTDEEFANPEASRPGRYGAICGHLVEIAPAIAPPGKACADCLATLRRYSGEQAADLEPRPPGLLDRLLRRRAR